MKITIVLDNGTRRVAKLPYENAPFVVMRCECPNGCAETKADNRIGSEIEAHTKISGTGIKHHNHDTFFADAIALCCKKKIGTIETKVETLFGIEEDELVLSGRYGKVY